MTQSEKDARSNGAAEDFGDTGGSVKAEEQPRASTTSVQHAEPEDAYLTGGQRNLQRRVLGLNVEGQPAQRPPDQSPGLHSTGSFTGVANGDTGGEKDKDSKS